MSTRWENSSWNRCDVCGQFIALDQFDIASGAVRRLVTPDTEFTAETYETLCKKHRTEAT